MPTTMNGTGYIEFLASKEEILGMLDAGYTKTQVYNALSSQGKWTTGYWNFYRVLKKLGVNKRKLEKLKIGAELVAETTKKPPEPPNLDKWPLPVPIMARKLVEKHKETKPEAGDEGSFGLEKKEKDEYF